MSWLIRWAKLQILWHKNAAWMQLECSLNFFRSRYTRIHTHYRIFLNCKSLPLRSGLVTWWLWSGGMTCGSMRALQVTWSGWALTTVSQTGKWWVYFTCHTLLLIMFCHISAELFYIFWALLFSWSLEVTRTGPELSRLTPSRAPAPSLYQWSNLQTLSHSLTLYPTPR